MDFMTFTQWYTSCCKSQEIECPEAPKKENQDFFEDDGIDECESKELSLNDMLESNKACRRKMKLWEETRGTCIYCGAPILARDFVAGFDADIEHIIPRSLGGYSRMDNLACSCRTCNREKGDLTAIDYMLSKDSTSLQRYMHRIRMLAISGLISEEKYYNLLHPKHLK